MKMKKKYGRRGHHLRFVLAICFSGLLLVAAGCAGVEPDTDATDGNISAETTE